MKMAYYPGCSLQGTARDYNESIHELCAALDISLVEIPDWNCCGASSAHMTNHEVAMRLSIRNLLQVQDEDLDILIPCPACFQRLKAADKALKTNSEHWDVEGYAPRFDLVHITTLLTRPEILAKIGDKITRPIADLRLACYYGCLSLRPKHLTDAPEHEMPTTLETIASCLGATPVNWSHRTECCSGSLTMTRPDIAGRLVGDIVRAAERGGANAMVTDCPMCQANVEGRQLDIKPEGPHLPVYYATELITAAINGSYPEKQQKLHLVAADVLQSHLARAAQSAREETR